MDRIVQAQESAFSAGIDPDQFWRLTPYELGLHLKALRERRQREDNIQSEHGLINAHQTVGYMVQVWNDKRLPSLRDELARLRSGWDGILSPESSVHALNAWLESNGIKQE